MKRLYMNLICSLLGFFLLTFSSAQTPDILESQMAKLNVHTALLVPSQGVDEFPLWSPDSRFLAANIEGHWFKVDTQRVELHEATWHGNRIGTVSSKSTMESVSGDEANDWGKHTQHATSELTTKSGFKVEIRRSGLSASLVVSRGKNRLVIWNSDLENCGELSASPNDEYVAYTCELNGVLVMDLKQASQAASASR